MTRTFIGTSRTQQVSESTRVGSMASWRASARVSATTGTHWTNPDDLDPGLATGSEDRNRRRGRGFTSCLRGLARLLVRGRCAGANFGIGAVAYGGAVYGGRTLLNGGSTEQVVRSTVHGMTVAHDILAPMTMCPRGFFHRCFVAGTLVSTRGGLVPIESVRSSETKCGPMTSLRENGSSAASSRRTKPTTSASSQISLLVENETVEATAGHPFWVVEGQNRKCRPRPEHIPPVPEGSLELGRWVDAGDLQVGDRLLLKDGRYPALRNSGFATSAQRFTISRLMTRHATQLPCVKSSFTITRGMPAPGRTRIAEPVESAGPHTGFKRDPQTGRMTELPRVRWKRIPGKADRYGGKVTRGRGYATYSPIWATKRKPKYRGSISAERSGYRTATPASCPDRTGCTMDPPLTRDRYTEDDFDSLGFHDCYVYGFKWDSNHFSLFIRYRLYREMGGANSCGSAFSVLDMSGRALFQKHR